MCRNLNKIPRTSKGNRYNENFLIISLKGFVDI
jgi:hypothetical protein